jgi:DtxR family Mn-dependent transcriptional regulator
MLPSSTVENYLKAIYLGATALPAPERLLPMGQLAASLGVAPGTATTMVKTLAESGLVEYEPYSGVTLTAAGEKLAALVLRRHRLVELFLVKVMGLKWDEVHDEAELLEHVVSDRLIDRMDEMLGRPEADPHGDPIPDPQGVVKSLEAQNLLTCPLHTPVVVTRVIDQDKAFLRFIESHNLKPGESIEVEDRDAASDSVRIRGKHEQNITIGARAASKLLVHVARVVIALMALCATASAQTAPAPSKSSRPWEILDNSFLVEEAFNQPVGVFQNIFGVLADEGMWAAAFTQEWPVFSHRHQFSYTLPFGDAGSGTGIGDALLNYRIQIWDEAASRPAFSPRVSLIVSSGASSKGLSGGGAGWQVNLPFSKQAGDLYVHWNAGFTKTPNFSAPQVAASGIWRARPMLNLMIESVVVWDDDAAIVTASPGLRTGWNVGDTQTIVGVAIPSIFSNRSNSVGVFGYFSYELPFTH